MSFDDLVYTEASSNYINIFTKTQKVITRQSLEWAEMEFLRTSSCAYTAPISLISGLSSALIQNHTEIPISRANVPKMYDYLGKK